MDTEPHRDFTRVISTGDWHCGHHFGLTPPSRWESNSPAYPRIHKRRMFQEALWGFLEAAIEPLRPIDVLLPGGDLIDGKGERSGGTEQITTDRHEQAEMAAEIINFIAPGKVRMVYGTRYHTGKDEDFENVIINKLDCKDASIQGHGFFNVNGCVIDDKHKVGGSTVPYGRMTALAKARLWNAIWNMERERQPLANILLRHHVHYHVACSARDWLAMTVPPLCYGTAFGIRECEGTVDVGLVKIDIMADGRYTWMPIFADFPEMKAPVESL